MRVLQAGCRWPDERRLFSQRGRLIEFVCGRRLRRLGEQTIRLGHQTIAQLHAVGMLRIKLEQPGQMKSSLPKITSLNRWLNQSVDHLAQFGGAFREVLSHRRVSHQRVFGVDRLFDAAVHLFEQHECWFELTSRQLALSVHQQEPTHPLAGARPAGSSSIQHLNEFVSVLQFRLVEQQVDAA